MDLMRKIRSLVLDTFSLKVKGFPDSSVGKESTCNAGDPRSIPGSGRSTGEGIGYPLQHSWASHVAQLVNFKVNIRHKKCHGGSWTQDWNLEV